MNSKVKIHFVQKDPDFKVLEKAMYKLVSFVEKNQDYMDYFADILLQFSTYSAERINKMEKRLNLIKKRLANENKIDLEKFDDFKKLIINYYKRVDTDDLYDSINKEVKKYDKSKFLTSQECLNIMRGKIFEIIVENMVKKRYAYPNCFCSGCMIILNGNELKTDKRKTVDVVGWTGSFGEFYECKVSPDSLDEDTYEYIYFIEKSFLNENINYCLACVTLDTQERLIAKSEFIEQKLGIAGRSIKMIGRERLEDIRNFEIQNEAS